MAGVSDPVRSGFKTPDWFAQYIIIILQKNFSIQIQGVQEKLCFFTIDCNPSLAYIAVRALQSSQRNVSVQSLLLAANFLYNQ